MEANRPWDWVFGEVLRDHQFWHLELEEPALLLLNRTRNLGDLLTSEAPVGEASKRVPPGDLGLEPRAKKPKVDKYHNIEGNLFSTNRSNTGLCKEYQDGTCISANGSSRCPRAGSLSHQCARCLAPNHGANACPHNDYPALATQDRMVTGKGKAKGKGKFKGKKGGGKWQY
eukprot:2042339-Heterocapsa_arctica.AAC.1